MQHAQRRDKQMFQGYAAQTVHSSKVVSGDVGPEAKGLNLGLLLLAISYDRVAAALRGDCLKPMPLGQGGRTGDPTVGEFGDAKVIRKFGGVPDDLSGL
jgi:hypothetical protein